MDFGHKFLSAHTREGDYRCSVENRTRCLGEIIEGSFACPGLNVAVRLSAFDIVPCHPDPALSSPKPRPGIPKPHEVLLPYRRNFGVNPRDPTGSDPGEGIQFLSLLEQLGISLVNLLAGSPNYTLIWRGRRYFLPPMAINPQEIR